MTHKSIPTEPDPRPAPPTPRRRPRGGVGRCRRRNDVPVRYDGATGERAVVRAAATAAAPRRDSGLASVPALLGAVRTAIDEYVAARGVTGDQIWQILPEVRALVARAGADELEPETRARLVDEVVRWTLESYLAVPLCPVAPPVD